MALAASQSLWARGR